MYILGVSAYYHDSAACLIYNDEVIAAAHEERFTRIKQDESFPVNAVQYCLQEAGIGLNDLEAIVYYEKPFLKFERLIESYYHFAPLGLPSFVKSIQYG
jgi:carbamoyltransferase